LTWDAVARRVIPLERIQIKNGPAGVLQERQAGVELGALLIQLRYPAAQLANLTDEPRIVLKDVTDRIEVSTRASIQAGIAHQGGGYGEGY